MTLLRKSPVVVAVVFLLAVGCSSGGSTTAGHLSTAVTAAPPGATAATTAQPPANVASTTTITAASAPTVFVPIPSILGSGPAQLLPDPGDCGAKPTTVDIEGCDAVKVENLDVKINQVQLAHFQGANQTAKAAILSDDAAWLAARTPVCNAIPQSGGSIDRLRAGDCHISLTAARLANLQGTVAPVMHLTGHDNADPTSIEFFTTAHGSLIGMIHSQGDQTGGGIISWHVIGGYQGFNVNPADFPFVDGGFIDRGIVQGSSAAGHHVATGETYEFSIDYSQLAKDPNTAAAAGRFRYSPGGIVLADWT